MTAAQKLPRRATYADLDAVPEDVPAELIDGELILMPKPAPPHVYTASALGFEIGGPFQRGRGGPGGWWILHEPELRLPKRKPGEDESMSPDLAGWRRARMPEIPMQEKFFSLAPDWVCEVLSKSTEQHDRKVKMPRYAREGVPHVWLVDPIAQTIEAYTLAPEGYWVDAKVYAGAVTARVQPFEAIELDLSALWAEAAGR